MGCSRAMSAWVTQGERLTSSNTPSRPATTNTAPKILTLEIVLALRWKICDIGRIVDESRRLVRAGKGELVELTCFLRESRPARNGCAGSYNKYQCRCVDETGGSALIFPPNELTPVVFQW